MSYFVVTRWGGSEDNPGDDRMREILAELDTPDSEHPDTWLTEEETGYTLSVFENGLVIWDRGDDDEPRHLIGISQEKALELWQLLAEGNITKIEAEPWKPGSALLRTAEEQAHIERITLEGDLKFYNSLGAENLELQCKNPDCKRGSIRFSGFCRVHHFENVCRKPCPFVHILVGLMVIGIG